MSEHDRVENSSREGTTRVEQVTLWVLIDRILTDWRRLLTLVGVSLALTLVLIVAVWGVLRVAAWNRLVITQTASGGVIYRVGQEETLTFLLSASAPWARTDFHVRRGEQLRITASGQVSLAIHHLIDSAKHDTRPLHAWVGPEGLPEERRGLFEPQDSWREQYLLVPKKPYGALVAAITPSGHAPGPGDPVFLVQSEWKGDAPATGMLWFAVNDVMLAPDRRLAYEVPPAHRSADYTIPRTFDEIAQDRYWNLWFDDNVGSFLVVARKSD